MNHYFANREFCFTLHDDIYVRYKSYTDEKELRDDLIKLVPHKIDIGAVYRARPRDHKTIKSDAFVPIARELVFDIDMDAFNEVRNCCKDAKVCHKCWKFMNVAIRVIDATLRSTSRDADINLLNCALLNLCCYLLHFCI